MIEDEKSLISIEEFRKMFFTFFKGEYKASLLYDKLLPFITVWEEAGEVYEQLDQVQDESRAEKRVSAQKLTIFIDSFNFYPVKVDKIHFKNSSNEMTRIMTGDRSGNLAEKNKTYERWTAKSADE